MRVYLVAMAATFASGCGDLVGIGVSLGYRGELMRGCEPVRAAGAMEIDRGVLHAKATGRGEVTCKDGLSARVDVRRPAKLELVVYASPRAGEAIYVYTHVLDAHGHALASDDRFVWTAQNGEIRPGTCDAERVTGCVADSTAATLVPAAPSTTIEVSYAGLQATRTLPVRR